MSNKVAPLKQRDVIQSSFILPYILYEGCYIWKFSYNHTSNKPHRRWFQIMTASHGIEEGVDGTIGVLVNTPSNALKQVEIATPLRLIWHKINTNDDILTPNGNNTEIHTLTINSITNLFKGHHTRTYYEYAIKYGINSLPNAKKCMSIQIPERTIDICFDSVDDCDEWYNAINSVWKQLKDGTTYSSQTKPSAPYDDRYDIYEEVYTDTYIPENESNEINNNNNYYYDNYTENFDYNNISNEEKDYNITEDMNYNNVYNNSYDHLYADQNQYIYQNENNNNNNNNNNDIENEKTTGYQNINTQAYIKNIEKRIHLLIEKKDIDALQTYIPSYKHIINSYINIIHISCMYGNENILKICIDNGFDICKTDYMGRTPLHIASEHNHPACIALCLDYGGDVCIDAVTLTYKHTALHYSVIYTSYDCVKMLLQSGADTSIKNYQGKTARELAYNSGHTRISNLIMTYESVFSNNNIDMNTNKSPINSSNSNIINNNEDIDIDSDSYILSPSHIHTLDIDGDDDILTHTESINWLKNKPTNNNNEIIIDEDLIIKKKMKKNKKKKIKKIKKKLKKFNRNNSLLSNNEIINEENIKKQNIYKDIDDNETQIFTPSPKKKNIKKLNNQDENEDEKAMIKNNDNDNDNDNDKKEDGDYNDDDDDDDDDDEDEEEEKEIKDDNIKVSKLLHSDSFPLDDIDELFA